MAAALPVDNPTAAGMARTAAAAPGPSRQAGSGRPFLGTAGRKCLVRKCLAVSVLAVLLPRGALIAPGISGPRRRLDGIGIGAWTIAARQRLTVLVAPLPRQPILGVRRTDQQRRRDRQRQQTLHDAIAGAEWELIDLPRDCAHGGAMMAGGAETFRQPSMQSVTKVWPRAPIPAQFRAVAWPSIRGPARARAPGDEIGIEKLAGLRQVAQRCTVDGLDGAAGGGKHGMAGRDVPGAGRTEARIDVGFAGSEQPELHRGADPLDVGDGVRGEEPLGLAGAVRPAGDGAKLPGHRPTRADRRERGHGYARPANRAAATIAWPAPPEASVANSRPVAGASNKPNVGYAVLDQRDVDGEVVAALDELARAVERIDQERPAVDVRHAAGAHLLLRQHRHRGCDARQRSQHDRLGGAVGGGDRRMIGLGLDRQPAGAHGQQRAARIEHSRHQCCQQSIGVDRRHARCSRQDRSRRSWSQRFVRFRRCRRWPRPASAGARCCEFSANTMPCDLPRADVATAPRRMYLRRTAIRKRPLSRLAWALHRRVLEPPRTIQRDRFLWGHP